MKKLLVALTLFGLVLSSPASAWYRGGGYYGGYGYNRGWNGYGYGYNRGWGNGWGGAGAAAGIGLGLGLLGGALAAQQYNGGYYCQQRPVYDAWGNFIGYSGC